MESPFPVFVSAVFLSHIQLFFGQFLGIISTSGLSSRHIIITCHSSDITSLLSLPFFYLIYYVCNRMRSLISAKQDEAHWIAFRSPSWTGKYHATLWSFSLFCLFSWNTRKRNNFLKLHNRTPLLTLFFSIFLITLRIATRRGKRVLDQGKLQSYSPSTGTGTQTTPTHWSRCPYHQHPWHQQETVAVDISLHLSPNRIVMVVEEYQSPPRRRNTDSYPNSLEGSNRNR